MNARTLFRPVAAALLAAGCLAAHAGPVDALAWTVANTDGGNGVATIAPDSLTLVSADFTNNPDQAFVPTELTATVALAAGTAISFDWAYTTADDGGSDNDVFGWLLDGRFQALSAGGSFDPQSGRFSLVLDHDAVFGLAMNSNDGWGGSATAVVSDFAAVPEPATLPLVAVAFGGLLLAGKRRRG